MVELFNVYLVFVASGALSTILIRIYTIECSEYLMRLHKISCGVPTKIFFTMIPILNIFVTVWNWYEYRWIKKNFSHGFHLAGYDEIRCRYIFLGDCREVPFNMSRIIKSLQDIPSDSILFKPINAENLTNLGTIFPIKPNSLRFLTEEEFIEWKLTNG